MRLDEAIIENLVDLRARPEARRGPYYLTNESLDKDLAALGVDWRQVRIEKLEDEIAQLRKDQLENADI